MREDHDDDDDDGGDQAEQTAATKQSCSRVTLFDQPTDFDHLLLQRPLVDNSSLTHYGLSPAVIRSISSASLTPLEAWFPCLFGASSHISEDECAAASSCNTVVLDNTLWIIGIFYLRKIFGKVREFLHDEVINDQFLQQSFYCIIPLLKK